MMPTDRPGGYRLNDAVEVPPDWQRLDPSGMSGLIMLVGDSDTGKTTLFRYLVDRLSAMHRQVFVVDADPGQGRLGPPTMISLAVVEASGARHVTRHIRHRFVGSTSPSAHMLQVLTGCARLVEKARGIGAGPIVMDTSGLIDPQKGGLRLKFAKVDLLRPSVLIGLQRGRELENLLATLRIGQQTSIIEIKCASAVRRRQFDERQSFREESFRQYFKNAAPQTFFWPRYGVFPYPRFCMNGLLGFADEAGFALGLGIVKKIEACSKTISVLTPLTEEAQSRIRGIQLGDVALDPSTFKHSLRHPRPAGPNQCRTRP
ncbi:MAG: hypothetical protein KGY61_03255 [Desulfobacterales bacterium]|nr:hypothetical protein [Desulfobacterales bacterium]